MEKNKFVNYEKLKKYLDKSWKIDNIFFLPVPDSSDMVYINKILFFKKMLGPNSIHWIRVTIFLLGLIVPHNVNNVFTSVHSLID